MWFISWDVFILGTLHLQSSYNASKMPNVIQYSLHACIIKQMSWKICFKTPQHRHMAFFFFPETTLRMESDGIKVTPTAFDCLINLAESENANYFCPSCSMVQLKMTGLLYFLFFLSIWQNHSRLWNMERNFGSHYMLLFTKIHVSQLNL